MSEFAVLTIGIFLHISVIFARMPDAEVQGEVEKKVRSGSADKAGVDDDKKEPEDLLALAEQLYEKGKLGECLVVLEAAKAGGSPGEQVGRQRLVVQMQIAAKNKEWWKVSVFDVDCLSAHPTRKL